MFMVRNKNCEIVVRQPGEIAGNQFIIEECEGCTIFLADYADSMTVDLCKNCTIFLAGCQGSVFVRDCVDCRFVLVCQQFRSRDCKDCKIDLYARTRPIIESSSGMSFACYNGPSFEGHEHVMEQAGLDPFVNIWFVVHDFNEVGGEIHFTQTTREPIEIPTEAGLKLAECPVPLTRGRAKDDMTYVIVPGDRADIARQIVRTYVSSTAFTSSVAAVCAGAASNDQVAALVTKGGDGPRAHNDFFSAAMKAKRVIVIELEGSNAPFDFSDAVSRLDPPDAKVVLQVAGEANSMVRMTWMATLEQK
ncbi:Tubulin binding cofactor C [Carpediemonas membranifera]|uniref:Tubulin binding cofactor C n=1 Tax=Carpediemonas membranifera TaxID=201153 RepID=A0A8J6ARL5_9EUKA|nr:Tubulin binding cofactor C [Carpediemonas membranifera]|eukprot:KAG9392203.1 Tubulin binding cofactor C [Carpediemonas membranifera]